MSQLRQDVYRILILDISLEHMLTVSHGFAASPEAKLQSLYIVKGTKNSDINEMTKMANIGVPAFCSASMVDQKCRRKT